MVTGWPSATMPPDAAVCMAAITGRFDGSEAWHTMSSVFFARERATFMRRLSRKKEGRAPSTTQLNTTWSNSSPAQRAVPSQLLIRESSLRAWIKRNS